MATRTETHDEARLRMVKDLDRVDWRGDGCTDELGELQTIEEITMPKPINVVFKEADEDEVKP